MSALSRLRKWRQLKPWCQGLAIPQPKSAAGGALSTGEATALAAFVASAKSAGYWTKLNDVMPLCGGFAGCTVKLKSQYGSALRLVGMSSGDYGSLGLTGDGSSKYVRTGVMYSDASRAGVGGLACFLTAHGTATSASQFMGVSWGSLGTRMGFLWNGASASTVLATFDGSDTIESSAVANAKPPVGLYHIERSSTTLAKFYGNGSPITADLTATITPTVQAVEVTLCQPVFDGDRRLCCHDERNNDAERSASLRCACRAPHV